MENLEYSKKMVLVPQELIERIRNEPSPPPQSVKQSHKQPSGSGSLDAEMHRILEDKSLGDNEKWKQYQQILQRFLHFSAQKRKPISMPVIEEKDENDEQDIVQTFPNTYQNDVRNLLRFIKRHSQNMKWDPDGTVVVRNVKIPGSNIVDVLHAIVRVRRLDIPPLGWAEVLNELDELNVPTEYISNVQARGYLGREPNLEEGLVTPPPSVLAYRARSTGFPLTPPSSSTPIARRRLKPPQQIYESPTSSPSRSRSRTVTDTPRASSKQQKRESGPKRWERFN